MSWKKSQKNVETNDPWNIVQHKSDVTSCVDNTSVNNINILFDEVEPFRTGNDKAWTFVTAVTNVIEVKTYHARRRIVAWSK